MRCLAEFQPSMRAASWGEGGGGIEKKNTRAPVARENLGKSIATPPPLRDQTFAFSRVVEVAARAMYTRDFHLFRILRQNVRKDRRQSSNRGR